MITEDKRKGTDRVELKGIMSEFREALEDEIEEIVKKGQSSTLLYGGKRIEGRSAEFWYRFSVEYRPSVPADTPCKLHVGNEQYDVTVISCDEDSIVISSKKQLPEAIGKAKLENGATVLMERLIKCLEDNADIENTAGMRMLTPDGEVYRAKKVFAYDNVLNGDAKCTENQNRAVVSALTNDITYIWGPPGTGKTTVIGHIIEELYKRDRSVLVVSHTNTAVDGAIEKADETYVASHPDDRETIYPILRIGIPAKKLNERVLLENHVARLGKELYEQKNALEKEQSALMLKIADVVSMLGKCIWVKESRLVEIGENIRNIEKNKQHIEKLKVEITEVKAKKTRLESEHPEYREYVNREKELKEKRRTLENVNAEIAASKNEIEKLPAQIEKIKDEIKKYMLYEDLCEQESKFMSAAFINGEIDKASAAVALLDAKIKSLEEKQEIYRRTISDYEGKSSLAKFFAGKSTVTQAKTELPEIESMLTKERVEKEKQIRLAQEYREQLNALMLLKEQIKAVIPSHTKEYWELAYARKEEEYAELQEELPRLDEKKRMLIDEIDLLKGQLYETKVAFEKYNSIHLALLRAEGDLRMADALHVKNCKRCTELLEDERALCADFLLIPEQSEFEEIFSNLSAQMAEIKKETARVDIESLKKNKEDMEAEFSNIVSRVNEIKRKLQELEKQAVVNAKVVGATLAKSYLSDVLRSRKFDTVILDEASMASIPALWCASYLAEKNLVIVGDFLQLSPIVQAETPMAKKWLGRDIFDHSGMQGCARKTYKGESPENFVMLNDQFRMESDIAQIANMYYGEYKGGLRSHDDTERRVAERENFYSWYSGNKTQKSIHLIDTESLHAWVTGIPQGKGHSRLNSFSAAIDVELAFKFIENKLKGIDLSKAEPVEKPFVLIVAPYRPHVVLLNKLIDLEYQNRGIPNLNYVRAGTIHSFQGSEADIVIFDLVLDDPHWKANLFMPGEEINAELERMFNVAVTRAKFKLYIVGDFAYCRNRAKGNALSRLLDVLLDQMRLRKVDAKELLPNIAYVRDTVFTMEGQLTGKRIFCREDSFDRYFMADLHYFKERMIIYSPFMTENRLSELLPAFTDAINAGKQITVITKAPSDRGNTERSRYMKCEKELRDIGVTVLHKKGMHEKLIFIDDSIVWEGSLNVLSFTGMTGEYMHRYEDRDFTEGHEKIYNIKPLDNSIAHEYEQKCPICGDEMQVRESPEGGIYWECVNNDYARGAEQTYPIDGILRCGKCGGEYVFSMKKEPRWVCTNDSKHYQKIRSGDLKLEKMAALIPTKTARREVERYFALKGKEHEGRKSNVRDHEFLPDQMKMF